MFRQPGQESNIINGKQDPSAHESVAGLIADLPLFADLEPSLHRQIEGISRLLTAAEDAVLSLQGEMPRYLHLLLDGQVALTSTMADGTTAVILVVHPGEHFILPSVLAGLPYLMTARALMAVRAVAVDGVALRQLAEREPLLASALLRSMSYEFRGMVQQVRDLKLRTAAQRLGCYLLARVQDAEARKADFRLPFEKALLAAQIGCGQETLSRAFAALRRHGVETHGSRVILHDIPRLRLLAIPDGPGEFSPA